MKKTQLLFIFCVFITQLQAQNGFYKHLKGKIGNYPITMDLTKTEKGLASDAIVIGAYSYDNSEGLLLLRGRIKGDSLVFVEKDNINQTGHFALKQVNETQFVGTWTNERSKKVLKVTLNEDYTEGAMRFKYVMLRDSFDFFKETTKELGKPLLKIKSDNRIISSLFMRFERQYLVPQTDVIELKNILTEYISFFPPPYTQDFSVSPSSFFDKEIKSHSPLYIGYFLRYYETDWKKDTVRDLSGLDKIDGYFPYNHPQCRTNFVLFNDGNILTIANFDLEGSIDDPIQIFAKSIDIKGKKTIEIHDILKDDGDIGDDIRTDVLKYLKENKQPKYEYLVQGKYGIPNGIGDLAPTSKGLIINNVFDSSIQTWVMNLSKIKPKIKLWVYDMLKIEAPKKAIENQKETKGTLPRFAHRRYTGNFAGKPVSIDFTVRQSENPRESGLIVSAYLNRFYLSGQSNHHLDVYKIEKDAEHNHSDDMNLNGSIDENIGFYTSYSDSSFISQKGYLDKAKKTYSGIVEFNGENQELTFNLKEDNVNIANNSILPKFEQALSQTNFHSITNYDVFEYTYYDPKIVSGVFAFDDTTSYLGKSSKGCVNYAYSYNIEQNKIIDIDKIFKLGFREKIHTFLMENFSEIGWDEEKLKNGRFFVAKDGLVFVKIQAKDCYEGAYHGHQYFLPFRDLKDLKLIDEEYCRSMGIELGY